MKAWIAALGLTAAVALAVPATAAATADQTTALSAASKKSSAKKVPVRRAAPRRAEPQGMIACTVTGCQRIPRGCHPETQYDWDGMPTGYDAVVCRPGS